MTPACAATALLAVSVVVSGCGPETAPGPLPGAALRARLEAHMDAHREDLKASLSHYGLLFEIPPVEFERFMLRIHVRDGVAGPVLGVAHAPEIHGGGVLALLLGHWRPEGRAARLDDRFLFVASRRRVPLAAIYDALRRQVFLPVPGVAPEAIAGRLPAVHQLPRVRFAYGPGAGLTETDAYALLGLLLRFEPDPAASWRNHLEQELSVDRLLAAARAVYLSGPPVGDAIDDHTKLHLVELLLAHDALRPPGPGANAVKERFLAVELGRERFDGEVGSEVLAHTVESLGRLLASPRVSWTPEEARRVRRWLLVLERDRYPDLDRVPLQHLAHTLEGLRLVAASGTIPRP